MKIEKFGYNEKAFTDEEWFEVKVMLSRSPKTSKTLPSSELETSE